MRNMKYEPQKIEEKWQERWEKEKIFEVDMDPKKDKYYVLEMYPYPSSKLHMGHLRNYSIGDSFARFKRMQGLNVLYPMGYDSFGLPAENAAIDHGIDPKKWTNENINAIKNQQNRIGLSYDWNRMIYSHDPDYYKWDQWFFLKMLEKDLAYRQDSYVNWCEKCVTVLANEQVQGGKCWRCGSEVEQKFLTQWFLKIRAYAEELLEGLEEVDWPEKVKVMQRNWIGRSEGTIIKFPIMEEKRTIDIFTTRPDTLYGVTFMVFAPEHPWVRKWVEDTQYEDEFENLYRETMKQNQFERTDIDVEKKGMFIGKYAVNPLTEEQIPIYVGNFVIYEYGAGAVMAVPAHDQRDFEFAKEYGIPIKVVIQPFDYELNAEKMTRAYESDGVLINSEEFNGMENRTAIGAITEKLDEINMGSATINYKLRDWLISRQRYWGCPIPIVYCEKCGTVPVPIEDLPVKLPEDVKFTGKGNPLKTSESFINTKCPECGGKATRETDTMDTFVDSSWYFFRYCDPHNKKEPYGKKRVNYWGNVDQYIGGIEHAVMHLLYARFWTKVGRDLQLHSHNEPFQALLTQGMINKIHPYCPECDTFATKVEKDSTKCPRCETKWIQKSVKMSKSLGNTVDPNNIMEEYGADSARFFILFGASPESSLEWSEEGVGFAARFMNNTFKLLSEEPTDIRKTENIRDTLINYYMHHSIKDITESMKKINIRDAVNKIVQFSSELTDYKKEGVNKDIFNNCRKNLALILHPIAPHMTEEVWELLGEDGYISLAPWPNYDEDILTDENDFKWNLINNTIDDIKNIKQVLKKDSIEQIDIIIAEQWKFDFYSDLMQLIEDTINQGEIMKKLMLKSKFKPHGKFVSETVSKVLKNIGKYANFILSPSDELKFFKDIIPLIEKQFNATVNVLTEDETNQKKADQALPGRPSIIIN
ncbi:MAG: Leucine--tRNA ligase [Promethearchaeota archaeon]|nr:MAG: Leucine--tRNA ligase [Candidatus Lokiarchaeota archaeon]